MDAVLLNGSITKFVLFLILHFVIAGLVLPAFKIYELLGSKSNFHVHVQMLFDQCKGTLWFG